MGRSRVGWGRPGRPFELAEGAVRPIVRTPDPLLRRVARRCSPLDPGVAAVASDLVRTMREHTGCRGLSAPQVGELLRLVVVDVAGNARGTGSHGLLVLANPELVVATGSRVGREGCLSIPDLVADVPRATRILLVASSLDGDWISLESSGFEARVLQHELDHLDGVLILDRVRSLSDLSPRAHGKRPVPTAVRAEPHHCTLLATRPADPSTSPAPDPTSRPRNPTGPADPTEPTGPD